MDTEKVKQFIISQRESGIPDEEIYNFLQQKGVIPKPEARETFTGLKEAPFQATGNENLISGTAKIVGNAPRSAVELGKNVIKAVVHPVETVKSLGELAQGVGAKVGEITLENTDFGQNLLKKISEDRVSRGLEPLKTDSSGKLQVQDTEDLQKLKQVGQFVSDRYGSLDKLKETVIEDPVSVLADIATVFSGGATALGKIGEATKIGTITEAGQKLSQVSKVVEPTTSIGQPIQKTAKVIKESTPSRIIGEAIPSIKSLRQNEVVKSLDLTQGDLANIKKSTGNDVTDFIVSKNLIKETPEAIADALNKFRKDTKQLKQQEIQNVVTSYNKKDIPDVIKGLNTILEPIKKTAGLEDTVKQINTLLKKKSYKLQDIQDAQYLIDENSSIYSRIGETKAGASAKGLDNIRKNIKTFIEDEVTKSTDGKTNIKKLNNDIQTSFAIEDAINNRATRNLTRQKISLGDSVVLFGGSATFNPAVGVGLYISKKLIETPSFRLAFTKALSSKPLAKVKTLINEVKNKNVSESTQKFINEIVEEARKNLPIIESGSNVLDKTTSEIQQ